MKILFLEIDLEREWAVASIGPAYLAAFLRPHGHLVKCIRVPLDGTVEELAEQIRGLDPDLIGVSLTTRQWLRARFLLNELRKQFSIPVLVGGLHPTFSPEVVLAEPGVDFLCLGEGEQAMLELVEHLEQTDGRSLTRPIDNIWVTGGERPPLRPPFSPSDAFPFVARDMLDERDGVVHMCTQRGCPFPCTYCAAGQYNRMYGSNSQYGRRRSVENVMAELDQLREQGRLSYIIFLDDTFTIYPSWVHEFCKVHAARHTAPFSLHARPDTVDEEMIASLKKAGCAHMVYGVESGSLRIRQEVMQRPISNERMIEMFRMTREAGMMVTANYMLGLPGETQEDLEMTLDLHSKLQPDDFGFFVFYPYPGTRLYHVCLEQGLLPDDYLERPANHRESILRLPDLTAEQIGDYYDRFTALREAHYLARFGAGLDPHQKKDVAEQMRKCAATG